MAGEYEDLAREIVRAQMQFQKEQFQKEQMQKEPAQKPTPLNVNALFDRAPAWITLLVAAVIGYASLNTRVSTCEYQNQISITDRSDLRRRLDKTDDTLTEVRTDLGEIKVTLKQLAEQKTRQYEER